jgi:dTMP kinase
LTARRGRFIAFEGGEASGKSTQAAKLAGDLGALLTREPGGTAVGERVRALLLDPAVAELDARAEALLMAAARAEHVAAVIEPALTRGEDVVTDRFSGSTLAYQGYGRGLPLDELTRLTAWASAGVEPDLNVLLVVPRPLTAIVEPDRLEAAGHEFHQRVAAGFRALAAAAPDRWVVIDGGGTVDDVAARVARAVKERL